jgi:hypothetical protein
MVNKNLKKIIFKKLYDDLRNVEIIPYENSIWFIDREKKYWYFEFEKTGNLWWRYTFFNQFFQLFSLERVEYEPILAEWVEEVLNSRVSTTPGQWGALIDLVEEVLNSRVSTIGTYAYRRFHTVEEVLNSKVSNSSIKNVEQVFNPNISIK